MKQKTHLSLAALLLFTITLFFMAGCSDSSDNYTDEPINSTFTFAVISDSHIKNDTIFDPDTKHATQKFIALGEELSGKDLDFVVHTGDHVNDLYCPLIKNDPWLDPLCFGCNYKKFDFLDYGCCRCGVEIEVNCYGGHKYPGRVWHPYRPPKILTDYAKIVKENFHVPEYWMVLGNHDDRYFAGGTKYLPDLTTVIRDAAKHEWLSVFGTERSDDYFNLPAMFSYKSPKDTHITPYYEVTYGVFQLIMLDCTLYRPEHCYDPGCNDEIHFWKEDHVEQITWLEERLKDPDYQSAILFWHTRIKDDEFTFEKHGDFLEMFAAYKKKIKMVFTGHGHHFKEIKWYPDPKDKQYIPFYQTTSTVCEFDKKFDPPIPSYYHVQLNPDGTVEILNYLNILNPNDPERKLAAETACDAY